MENRSKALFVGNIIASIYSVVLLSNFIQVNRAEPTSQSTAMALVISIVFVVYTAGTVLGWLGFVKKVPSFIMISTIMYFSGSVTLFGFIPLATIILGFMGYSNQKKLNAQEQNKTQM